MCKHPSSVSESQKERQNGRGGKNVVTGAGADDTINALRPIRIREKRFIDTMCNGWRWVAVGWSPEMSNAFSPNAPKCGWLMAMFCFHYCCGYIFFIIYRWPGMSGRLHRYGLLCGTAGRMSTHTHMKRTYATDLFRDSEFLDMQ